jgi:hypothetical protein
LLAEPTKLQFLAWQDEWKTNKPDAARHPDGSPVMDPAELNWLRANDTVAIYDVSRQNLSPKPRFLVLWFSHPLLDQNTYVEPVLLDDQSKVIPYNMPAGSIPGGDARGQGLLGGCLFGCQYAVNLNLEATNLPPHLTVRLHYSITGPLENLQDIPVQPSRSPVFTEFQPDWQILSIGQNVNGKAFITVGVDGGRMRGRRIGVMAVLKDGRELAASGGGMPYSDAKINPQDFTVNEPVADVVKFRIGTRPIRTVEWTNVVLPGSKNELVQNVQDAAVLRKQRTSERVTEMKKFLIAMLMYSDDHANQWPDTLAQASPYLGDSVKKELLENADAYLYKRPETNLVVSAAPKTAVLFEKIPISSDGRLLGFADGHVEFVRNTNVSGVNK